MDVLYIPQLDETGGGGEAGPAGYRILRRVPSDGTVMLTDRAVTRVETVDDDPLRLVVPPETRGAARDFFVRLVNTGAGHPEVTFAAPSGETVSFETTDDEVFRCETGVNLFAFTETDQGVFAVSRKVVDIGIPVAFDPCGGALGTAERVYRLGAQYVYLPVPTKDGHVFLGWFTAAEGGVAVRASDRCKTGVTRLFAHWQVYVDPFVDAICPARDLTFRSETEVPWMVDVSTCASAPGSARSGAIPDYGSTSLKTTVTGKGTLTFKWKTSCEQFYDGLHLLVDGAEIAYVSGSTDWATYSFVSVTDAPHVVEWKYTKDGSVAEGNDCCWVDDVVWTPEG